MTKDNYDAIAMAGQEHGFHVHEAADCSGDGMATKGHFNPSGVAHGKQGAVDPRSPCREQSAARRDGDREQPRFVEEQCTPAATDAREPGLRRRV